MYASQGVPYGHAMGRVASGFNWADSMDKMFGTGGLMEKATFSSGDLGRDNRVFGEVLWQQVNVKTPLYGMLPKIAADEAPRDINSPRPVTFRSVFQPPSITQPAEGGAYGTPVVFQTREVEAQPKHSTIRFENTLLQELFAQIQDGVPFDNLTQIGEEYFQRAFETQGVARAVESSNQNGETYEQQTALVELDRVIASADEEANGTDAGGNVFADGDLDIYGIDRSATGSGASNEANWSDAVVDHNDGTDRQLTKDIITSTVNTLEDNGTRRENLVLFTGRDTAQVLSDIREDDFRYYGTDFNAGREVGDRGQDEAETRWGIPTTDQVSHFDGIPIVVGPHVPSDSLSRIFLLDMTTQSDPVTGFEVPKIGVETYIPMFTEVAGLGEQTNTLALGNLRNQVGMGITHEVVCTRFNHQAKIRDLEE